MSTRDLAVATANALEAPVIPLAVIVRLDIATDPLFGWSGIGDISFSGTGDTAIDGFTFSGLGEVITVSNITEQAGGSDVMEVTLPGVDPTLPEFKQLMIDRRRWQGRRAWVWFVVLDPDTYAVVGKPFRMKTGRMDQMPYNETAQAGGTLTCRIEGQQSYGDEPLGTRYAEQKLLNINDCSQDYIYSLANMTAALGQANVKPSNIVAPSINDYRGSLTGFR